MYECNTHWWTTGTCQDRTAAFHKVAAQSICYQNTSSVILYLVALTFILKVKVSNLRYFQKFICDYLAKTTDTVQVNTAVVWEVIYGLSNGILTFDLGSPQRSRSCIFRQWISWKRRHIRKHYYCHQRWKNPIWAFEWHICIWPYPTPKVMVMHLLMMNILPMVTRSKYYHRQQIASRVWAFCWRI